jgi:hypothetical protein
MNGLEFPTHLLPFARSDIPGCELVRSTQGQWSLRLWGRLEPLWASGFCGGLARARIAIRRVYARRDEDSRWIADFLIAPPEAGADPASINYRALAFGPRPRYEAVPLVLTDYALDGSPDLGSVLSLEVRGPAKVGFFASVLHTLARLALAPREIRFSTRDGDAVASFLLQTLAGRTPSEATQRTLAQTLEAARAASRARVAEASLAG